MSGEGAQLLWILTLLSIVLAFLTLFLTIVSIYLHRMCIRRKRLIHLLEETNYIRREAILIEAGDETWSQKLAEREEKPSLTWKTSQL